MIDLHRYVRSLLNLVVLGALLLAPCNADAFRVLLSWDPNPEPDIAGYKIYFGTRSRVYDVVLDVGNVTCTVITNLLDCTTYHFAATAYNQAALESDFSEECVVTPSCIEVRVSTAPSLDQPWTVVWSTNLPIRTVQMFFKTEIAAHLSTNRMPPGVTYQCLDGSLTIITNVPPLTNRPTLALPMPKIPSPPINVLGPFTNLFSPYP